MTATAWAPPTERLAQVRAFMAERVLPNEATIERQDADGDAVVKELQDAVRDAGLWAPHVPPEAGGTGTGFLDYAYLNEHIGRSVWGQLVFGCQAPDAGNAEILHLFGTDEQRATWLAPARRRHDPLVLLDDRARGARLGPDHPAHPRASATATTG